MPKVKVNDIQTYYEMKGKGFPLVMICGMAQNLTMWDPRFVKGVSKHFKLLLFDNRGAGRTEISKREYTIRLFADDTAGLMNALGIPKAHILGLSMGGAVAQELAINYPEKVEKLILCSTCSEHRGTQEERKMTETIAQASKKELIKMSLSSPLASDYPKDFLTYFPMMAYGLTSEFIKENPDLAKQLLQVFSPAENEYPISRRALMNRYDAMLRFNSQTRLKLIKAPTLVLHGRKDTTVAPENGSILARAIPNAKLVYFEKSNHMLAEEMEEVLKVITEFLL
ncbi:MAG TPA: alpha/beta hydrolase [Candidatus Acidoferrum sp.]|nr:alpha/beta hydrolase [Candidatus Acidoferrum sp.]